MNARIPEFPTRPDEVPPAATAADLLDAYNWHLAGAVGGRSALPDLLAAADRHEAALASAASGLERRPAREVADHAIAVLSFRAAATIRMEMTRGAILREALAHGASLAEVRWAIDGGDEDVLD